LLHFFYSCFIHFLTASVQLRMSTVYKRIWNRRVFLLKTDTNPYSWPYPTHEAGSWTQPTHERQKTRGLWPRGVCPGSFGRTPPETIGGSRTEFNRILCTSKSEVAVTSNKKLRCRYVEANYRQTRSIAQPLCDSWASCIDMLQYTDFYFYNVYFHVRF